MIRGPAAIYYSDTNTCGTSVGAGKSCTITVEFRPPNFGIFNATVFINDDGGGSPQTVSLTAMFFELRAFSGRAGAFVGVYTNRNASVVRCQRRPDKVAAA